MVDQPAMEEKIPHAIYSNSERNDSANRNEVYHFFPIFGSNAELMEKWNDAI